MRKVLVAILCLVFLGACTRKDVEEQTEIPGSGLTLAVRSGDSLIAAGIPAAVYDLTNLGVNEPCTPLYFAVDEKISFTDLDAGVHTFFVLGNKTVLIQKMNDCMKKDSICKFIVSACISIKRVGGGN